MVPTCRQWKSSETFTVPRQAARRPRFSLFPRSAQAVTSTRRSYMSNYTESEIERFFALIGNQTEFYCWPWLGFFDKDGYPLFRRQNGSSCRAQRYSYETFRTTIPDRLVTDHICRNKICVNPFHLQAVTDKVNLLRGNGACALNSRKRICKWGHPLSGENLITYKYKNSIFRACRECRRRTAREWWRSNKRKQI